MPKAILEFNLPEEVEEFNIAQQGGAISAALQEIDQFLRSKTKYSDGLSDDELKAYQTTRDKLREICYDLSIDF